MLVGCGSEIFDVYCPGSWEPLSLCQIRHLLNILTPESQDYNTSHCVMSREQFRINAKIFSNLDVVTIQAYLSPLLRSWLTFLWTQSFIVHFSSKQGARKGTPFIVLFSVSGCYIPMTNDPPAEESVLCSSLLSRSNNKSFKLNYSTDNRLYIFEYLLKVCKAKTQTLIHNFLHIC